MNRRDLLLLGFAGAAAATLRSDALALDGSATTPRPMSARMADDLCESYLVNVKLSWSDTVYGYTDAVVDLLKELGVRTVRERLATGSFPGADTQRRAMVELAEAGIRWHATVGGLEDWADATAVNRSSIDLLASYFRPRVGGDLGVLLHSLGGCNEVDGPVLFGQYDPAWAEHARLMQAALWAAAKNEPTTRDIPIAGPSTRTDVTPDRAARLGDLSAVCDVGNAHLYSRGGSPSQYLDDHLDVLRPCFPDVSDWIITEAGYNDSEQDDRGATIPEGPIATYTVRGICDYFTRRSVYGRFELLDDPDVVDDSTQATINRTADWEAHFGMVAMTRSDVGAATPDTWRLKPEFHTTRRFLALMSDQGPPFSPDELDLALFGGGGELRHALVQKRDGRHYLLLWRDVAVATTYPDASRVSVPPEVVGLRLRTARPIAVHCPRLGSLPIATYPARTSAAVPVGGDLIVVEIG